MAILGITNRTENWKTARHFAPLFGANSVRLARRLLAHEDARAALRPGEVRLELFWCGMRDYFEQIGKKSETEKDTLAEHYSKEFVELRKDIQEFTKKFTGRGKLRELKPHNYCLSPQHDEGAIPEHDPTSKLVSNLLHTEVDIVLESPRHLFIGEAKHESSFGTNSEYVLVHQFIREYVMASILLKLLEQSRTVVPFVVGNDRKDLLNQGQVRFMIDKEWMREENVLEWSDIEALR